VRRSRLRSVGDASSMNSHMYNALLASRAGEAAADGPEALSL
jgi:hypothetical protein